MFNRRLAYQLQYSDFDTTQVTNIIKSHYINNDRRGYY